MEEPYVFLKFHAKLLKIFGIFPEEHEDETNKWKRYENYFFLIILSPTFLAIGYDLFASFFESDFDITIVVQLMLAWICIFGEYYMCVCFINNRASIKKLISKIADFQEFSSMNDMIETDKRAIFYTKGLIIYASLGSFIYCTMPILTIAYCKANKSDAMLKHGIPCGMAVRMRMPFRFDYTPMYQIIYANQIFTVFMVCWIIVTLTMLLCGVVMHATHHFKKLRELILEAADYGDDLIEEKFKFCIRYHIHIINFCEEINESFGSQMVVHLSLTSFLISILGFIIIMVEVFLDAVRFTLHLFGWLCLLLLVCYYGQTLIDESVGVGYDAYMSHWYNTPTYVQKDMQLVLLRCQKPIHLKVMNIGHMSFETFLAVMSSAYSYFTLLINIK